MPSAFLSNLSIEVRSVKVSTWLGVVGLHPDVTIKENNNNKKKSQMVSP